MKTYVNGSFLFSIDEDGTLVRDSMDELGIIDFPSSIDVKITNYCDMGCQYCHESSTVEGLHGDLDVLADALKALPKYVEIAIGGGNPLSHPNLIDFLEVMKKRGIICNLTVNQGHIFRYFELIKYLIDSSLISGLGISINSNNFKYIKKLKSISNNIVYHVIAGVNKLSVMDDLIEIGDPKILILGYKTFGFGKQFYSDKVEENISNWRMFLPKYVGKSILCFDNLAIEQLKIKRLFTDEGWDKFYMGDDFSFTCYIDAIKQEYAPTSRSSNRKSFSEYSLLDYFKKFRNE